MRDVAVVNIIRLMRLMWRNVLVLILVIRLAACLFLMMRLLNLLVRYRGIDYSVFVGGVFVK